MKNDYQKYLETQSKNLDDWENIANQSLKEKTIDSLKKEFDGNLEKKILYTENDITLESNHAYARGLKEEVNELNLDLKSFSEILKLASVSTEQSILNFLSTKLL